MLQYRLPLLAVRDVELSKRFYKDLFDQDVALDLGENVTFSGGFAIQQDFDRLIDVPRSTVLHQSNNMELYFETEDYDGFLRRLGSLPGVPLATPPTQAPWGQRLVRLCDPDGHLIEVGESMAAVIRRFLAEGTSVEEAARRSQYPVEFVRSCAEGNKKKEE